MKIATLYIGTEKDCNGNAVPAKHAEAVMQDVLMRVSLDFGGCTITDGIGAFTHADGTLAIERAKVVTIVLAANESHAQVEAVARFAAFQLHQSSVLVTYHEADARFVTPDLK